MATAPRVREQLRRQPPDPPVLVLDLTAVTFLGGAGITVVLEAAQAVPGGLQVVIAPDGPVRRAFRVTGVDRVLSLHADLDDALAAAALQD
jgi:anti-anti-sigma factor